MMFQEHFLITLSLILNIIIRKANVGDLDSLTNLIYAFYKEGEIIESSITKLISNPKQTFSKYLKESIVSKKLYNLCS